MVGDGLMAIKILLFGCSGNMGKTIIEKLKDDKKFIITAGVSNTKEDLPFPVYHRLKEVEEKADVLVDFSSPDALSSILEYGVENSLPLVLATTGYSENHNLEIKRASSKIPIFKTANMSFGINIMVKILREISSLMESDYDIEIIEKHHNKKADSPSGTANMLKDTILEQLTNEHTCTYGRKGLDTKRKNNEIGIHAVRGGTISGEHSILFAGEDEILEIGHQAQSKKLFAKGALKAAEYIIGKDKGLYNMDDLIRGLGGLNGKR
jgi:4-hydroxy-tetrahydrodipicolinate reductase